MAQWYAQVNGQRFGPASEEDMKSWVAQGRVKSTDYVWSEGMANWVTAASAFGASTSSTSQTTPASTPVQQVHVMHSLGGQLPAAPGAVTSMVCGIIGVAFGCTGLVMGIIALKQAKTARAAIAANPGQYGGEGMATAGHVLGIIGVILGSIVALYFVVVFTCMGGACLGMGSSGFH